MKKILLTALLACHLVIPMTVSAKTINNILPTSNSVQKNQIIAYFSPITWGNEYSAKALTKGYYRVLLDKNAQGQYLVQDFYTQTRTPQSAPFWLSKPEDLHSFDLTSVTGELKLYYATGEVYFTTQYNQQQQLIGPSKLLNHQGQLLSQEIIYADGSTQSDYWYHPNVPALKVKFDSDGQILQAQGWDTEGKAIAANECFAEKTLEPKNQLDTCYLIMNLLNDRNQTLIEEP
ncbi:hypothetical protein [Acinetobacter sp. ANC 4639]